MTHTMPKKTLNVLISANEALEVDNALQSALTHTLTHAWQVMQGVGAVWDGVHQVGVYFAAREEARILNHNTRGKNYATNVLSFASGLDVQMAQCLGVFDLGELVICLDVLECQAHEQDKTLVHHLMHLGVHGFLHLLGFDHEEDQSAQEEMEALEILILDQLGVSNPYCTGL